MSDRRVDISIAIPFVIFTFIWGTTWIVIRDQLGTVPAQWSITYRFAIAAIAMAAVARWKGESLRLPLGGLAAAAALGFFQFVVNFNAVYMAEHHITSGLVATVFALLLIPNSLLAWAFLGQRPTNRFIWSSLVAVAGIAMLFAHELRQNPARSGEVLLGIGLTLAGMLGASVANVFQAREEIKRYPLFALLTWAMAIGAVLDGLIALVLHWRTGGRDAHRILAGPVLPCPVRVRASLLALPSRRPEDRTGQGGLFQRDRSNHRDGLLDMARRLSLERPHHHRRDPRDRRDDRRA